MTTRFGDFEKRLAAIVGKLPKPRAKATLPPGLEWFLWFSTEELMLVEQILRAEDYGWQAPSERELGLLFWTELEATAKRWRAEGWPSYDDDPARYSDVDRSNNWKHLTLAERLRTSGTLSPPTSLGAVKRNSAGSVSEIDARGGRY
jgi:hypothetical protein